MVQIFTTYLRNPGGFPAHFFPQIFGAMYNIIFGAMYIIGGYILKTAGFYIRRIFMRNEELMYPLFDNFFRVSGVYLIWSPESDPLGRNFFIPDTDIRQEDTRHSFLF